MASFEAALQDKGFWLAQGDRRSHVAVDWRGEVYSLSRAIGEKKKQLSARLGQPDELLSVAETKAFIGNQLTPKIIEWAKEAETKVRKERLTLSFQSEEMVRRHRQVRSDLSDAQSVRWLAEEKSRAAKTPRGIRGLWGWITGKNRQIREINEAEMSQAKVRDAAERQSVIQTQILERQKLQRLIGQVRERQKNALYALSADIAKAILMGRPPDTQDTTRKRSRRRGNSRDQGPDHEPT